MDTAAPATYYVHVDHLHRPVRMSDAAKAFVWSAEYQPWGAVQSLSGALTMDLRFPGQWFQAALCDPAAKPTQQSANQ